MVEDYTWLIHPHYNHGVYTVENITYYDTNNVCNMFAIHSMYAWSYIGKSSAMHLLATTDDIEQ